MKPRALDFFCGAGGATKGLQRAGFHVTGVDRKPQPRYCGDVFHQADALTFEFSHTAEFVGGSRDAHPEICERCGLSCELHFDFIWASPPCQAFTALRFMPTAKEHPNLIPETRARLVESGIPYAIENVEGAPLGASGYLIMLCGTMFGLQTRDGRAELRRHRLFETSFSIPLRPACQHHHRSQKVLTVTGHTPVDNTRERRQSIAVCGNGSPISGRRSARGIRHAITVTGTGMGPRVSSKRAITVTGHTAQTNVERNWTRETFTVEDARAAMGIDWMGMAGLSQAIPPAYSEFIAKQFFESVSGSRQFRK